MKMSSRLVFVPVLCAASAAFAVRAPRPEPVAESFPVRTSGCGVRRTTTDFSHLRTSLMRRAAAPARSPRLMAAAPLPSRWDSREQHWVSPVKNQGSYGTCWAFSTMAALETAYLKATGGAVTNDFSENHMATHDVGFAFGFNDGGNNQLAAALLTAWRDPLREKESPYPNRNLVINSPPVCHVQDIVWIPERYCPSLSGGKSRYEVDVVTDNQAVDEAYKRAVMTYGAVSVCYYHVADCFNANTAAHCWLEADKVSYSNSADGGHAVTLIGWDDDYPVTNFKERRRPPAPGAFLFKNSWGTGANTTNGCLWISYYDEGLFQQFGAAFPEPEEPSNYGRVYEYDPCGQVTSWNACDTAAEEALGTVQDWAANVFTAAATGVVAAVGFYAMEAETAYTLRVYRGVSNAPDGGVLAVEQSGVVTNAGYVTLPLSAPVPLTVEKEKFSVVLHLKCPTYGYPLPVECSWTDRVDGVNYPWSACTAHAGESFMSKDGDTWRDFQDYDRSGNFCIKAYTVFGLDGDAHSFIVSAEPDAGVLSLRVGEASTFSVMAESSVAQSALTYAWSVNGVPVDCDTSSFGWTPAFSQHGNCSVECHVRQGEWVDVRKWTVVVNADLWVSAQGAAGESDGTPGRPFRTITDACLATVEGDVVRVCPGVYRERLEAPSAHIEIRSTDGPDVTVLDAEDAGRCFLASQNMETELVGFTLVNGNADGLFGGGAFGGVLTDCVLSNCWAGAGGGAANAVLLNCRVIGNGASHYGGGVADSLAADCLFWQNWSELSGGAAAGCESWSELSGCTVVGNESGSGGGVDVSCFCADSIVWGNFDWGGNVSNWERFGNRWSGYFCTEFATSCTYPGGFYDDGGCVTADPLFAALARGDVRLMADSPCRGAAHDGRDMGCLQGPAPMNSTYVVGGTDADFATPQEALGVAICGDRVSVRPGVYSGVVNDVEGVLVESVDGAAKTVLDGEGVRRCFDDYGWATLVGFTLRNGRAVGDCGGGACGGALTDCVISNCTAMAGGGAALAVLTNCLVVCNRAEADGSVVARGGGVYDCLLFGCTVAGNQAASYGGGAYLDDAYVACNSIFAENVCAQGQANGNDVYGYGYYDLVSTLVDRDAKFVDSSRGDWRLSARSPAIDAGDNRLVGSVRDLDGRSRVLGPRVDLGCYEYEFAVPGWPTPDVEPGASEDAERVGVAAALASVGFAAGRASALKTVAQYAALADWSDRKGLAAASVAAGALPFFSAAVDAPGMLDVASDGIRVVDCRMAPEGGSWWVAVSVGGLAFDPSAVCHALLESAVGIRCAAALSDLPGAVPVGCQIEFRDYGLELGVPFPEDASTGFFRPVFR